MEGLNTGLVVGILTAIPLAIAANLLTPIVKRSLERRLAKGKSKKRIKARRVAISQLGILSADLEQIELLKIDQSKYWELLLSTIIRATMYGALGAIYSGMIGFVSLMIRTGAFGDISNSIYYALLLVGSMVGVVASMLVFGVTWRALRVSLRLSNYESYKSETELRIKQLSKQVNEIIPSYSPANNPRG